MMNLIVQGGYTESRNLGPARACPMCDRSVRLILSTPSNMPGLEWGLILGELTADMLISPDDLVGWVRHDCNNGGRRNG
jgi:hypothetical protein